MARRRSKPPDVSPYRSDAAPTAPASVDEGDGLVADLIRQFADPFAFYRELVQNAIDAGTPEIHVRLRWQRRRGGSGSDGVLHASVRDQGSGMTREILEEQLLVLFRSGKEGRTDKIGKFGVGFVSVLALEPEVVMVHTDAGDGEQWTLALHPDQSYELFERHDDTGRGTTVTLHLPMGPDKVEEFAQQSYKSLRRWCRHAQIPIHLVAHKEGQDASILEARIDEPLALAPDSFPMQVATREDTADIVIGVSMQLGNHGGFFNRGLTLFEGPYQDPGGDGGAGRVSAAWLPGGLVFKVQDPHLEHTLSRDAVRHDAAFQRVMTALRRTALGPLCEEVLAALRRTAGGERLPGGFGYGSLLLAALRSQLPVDRLRFPIPLLHSIQELTWLEVGGFGDEVYGARRTSPLTQALTTAGIPVVDLEGVGLASNDSHLDELLRRTGRNGVHQAERSFTWAGPAATTPSDAVLLDRTLELLDGAWRRPAGLRLAQLQGSSVDRLYITCDADLGAEGTLLPREEARRDPFRFGLRPPLLLAADHPTVTAARTRAGTEPTLAAALLARALLLTAGRLSERRDRNLTDLAMTRVLSGDR